MTSAAGLGNAPDLIGTGHGRAGPDLGLSEERAEHVLAGGAGFGLEAQLVHDGQVAGDVVGLVEVERADELLEVDQIGQVWFGEPQDGERAVGCGGRPGGEQHDLERYVGQVGELQQVLQLGSHHLGPARGPSQRRLIQHGPQLRGAGLGEQLLALHPETDAAVDLLGGRVGVGQQDDGAGVVFGLRQAVNELHLIGADDADSLDDPAAGRDFEGARVAFCTRSLA